MPYIPSEDRPAYDRLIDQLVEILAAQPADRRKGHANYVITQLVRKAWGDAGLGRGLRVGVRWARRRAACQTLGHAGR